MTDKKGFYITTPIYYVNDVPHIGHAYTTIACDTLARWHRLGGEMTRFLTGTDEHGQKVQQAAEKRGMTAIELCDEVVVNFQKLWQVLDISNDDFIRTTEKRHKDVVQIIFQKLLDSDDIYKGSYEGWYCVPCETYVPEAQMLEGNTCPDCKRPLTKMSEESYFFRLSKYQDALLAHYETHPDAVMPRARYNEVVSFIKSGLQDLSISRTTLQWGIPVPGDEKHVIYVWLDALINYLSAVGYPVPGEKWETYWPIVRHMVGKDIIRFHAVIWPAVLMALGLNPPVRVFAHGWWTVEGEKMSKSKGNVVDPFEMAEFYGVDVFRYFVMREVPFGNDGDFSEQALVQRVNSDLANDIGNLLNRTLQMVEKYRKGIVPCCESDSRMKATACTTVKDMEAAMDNFALDEALKILWSMVSAGNKYIDETAPWKLGREEAPESQAALDTVLRTLWEVLRLAAILVNPFMPDTSRRMWAQLGLADTKSVEETGRAGWEWGSVDTPIPVNKAEVLFPRIDMDNWRAEKAARDEKKRAEAAAASPSSDDGSAPETIEQIGIEDFKKLELRVALIENVETVKRANRLYKLSLDVGREKRVIVSSIREHFEPEDLIGKKIVLLCNLKPAKFAGIESNGMLLAAENEDENGDELLALLTVDADIPIGSRVN